MEPSPARHSQGSEGSGGHGFGFGSDDDDDDDSMELGDFLEDMHNDLRSQFYETAFAVAGESKADREVAPGELPMAIRAALTLGSKAAPSSLSGVASPTSASSSSGANPAAGLSGSGVAGGSAEPAGAEGAAPSRGASIQGSAAGTDSSSSLASGMLSSAVPPSLAAASLALGVTPREAQQRLEPSSRGDKAESSDSWDLSADTGGGGHIGMIRPAPPFVLRLRRFCDSDADARGFAVAALLLCLLHPSGFGWRDRFVMPFAGETAAQVHAEDVMRGAVAAAADRELDAAEPTAGQPREETAVEAPVGAVSAPTGQSTPERKPGAVGLDALLERRPDAGSKPLVRRASRGPGGSSSAFNVVFALQCALAVPGSRSVARAALQAIRSLQPPQHLLHAAERALKLLCPGFSFGVAAWKQGQTVAKGAFARVTVATAGSDVVMLHGVRPSAAQARSPLFGLDATEQDQSSADTVSRLGIIGASAEERAAIARRVGVESDDVDMSARVVASGRQRVSQSSSALEHDAAASHQTNATGTSSSSSSAPSMPSSSDSPTAAAAIVAAGASSATKAGSPRHRTPRASGGSGSAVAVIKELSAPASASSRLPMASVLAEVAVLERAVRETWVADRALLVRSMVPQRSSGAGGALALAGLNPAPFSVPPSRVPSTSQASEPSLPDETDLAVAAGSSSLPSRPALEAQDIAPLCVTRLVAFGSAPTAASEAAAGSGTPQPNSVRSGAFASYASESARSIEGIPSSLSPYWLVLERCACTVREWRTELWGEVGPLSPTAAAAALRVFSSACLCVATLHSKGVIHCDIKADNFLLRRRPTSLLRKEVKALKTGAAAAKAAMPSDTSMASVPSNDDDAAAGAPVALAPETQEAVDRLVCAADFGESVAGVYGSEQPWEAMPRPAPHSGAELLSGIACRARGAERIRPPEMIAMDSAQPQALGRLPPTPAGQAGSVLAGPLATPDRSNKPEFPSWDDVAEAPSSKTVAAIGTAQSDAWGLGCMLVELLGGKYLYGEEHDDFPRFFLRMTAGEEGREPSAAAAAAAAGTGDAANSSKPRLVPWERVDSCLVELPGAAQERVRGLLYRLLRKAPMKRLSALQAALEAASTASAIMAQLP
jgi:serine/threonine protein kinase